MTDTSDRVLATLHASPPRRFAAIVTFALLGGLLIWLGFSASGAYVAKILFVLLGIGTIAMADVLRRATDEGLVLTRTELRTEGGRVLALVADVDRVERGAFAFKPSNGFLVRLRTKAPGGWAPGLWWRRGTYLGIGGVVPGGQAKAMAEILTALTLGIVPGEDGFDRSA